jgi:hypothetical protein
MPIAIAAATKAHESNARARQGSTNQTQIAKSGAAQAWAVVAGAAVRPAAAHGGADQNGMPGWRRTP